MSTIDMMVKSGALVLYRAHLPRRHLPQRAIFLLPEMVQWVRSELPRIEALDVHDLSPRLQVFMLFNAFVAGEPMRIGRMFHAMRPVSKGVYELKTPDIRIFGWFYRRDVYIAAQGCPMVDVKTEGTYAAFRDRVVDRRSRLPLDEPKYLQGASEDDVVSV